MSEVQTGWQRLPLGELSTVDSGFAFKSEDFQSVNVDSQSIPVIRMSDLNGGYLQTKEAANVDVGILIGLERYMLQTADFLFGMSGSLANYAVVRESDLPAVLNQRVGRLRAKPGYCQEFINYSFISDSVQAAIWEMATGAAQLNISISDIRNLDVLVPPLPEQQKIAAILTAVDDKLDLIARQISATQTLKLGLMQTLFTRGAGTPDAQGRWHPHTDFQDTELGRIPMGWTVTTVNDLGELKNGINKAKEDFGHGGPFVNLMDVFGKTSIQSADFGLVATTEREREDFSLKAGDFLFIRSSVKPSGVGLAALVEAELPGAVYSGFLIRLRPRLKDVVSRFLMHFFASDAFRKYLLPKSTISANTNINQGALGSLPVAMPDINEQRYIADVLDQLDQKLTTLTTQQTHYQSLKRGLMQKLLTGEWRVRVEACGYNP